MSSWYGWNIANAATILYKFWDHLSSLYDITSNFMVFTKETGNQER